MTRKQKVKFEWQTWIVIILSAIVISYNFTAWIGWKPFGDEEVMVNWILLPLALGISVWLDFSMDGGPKLSQKEKFTYILSDIIIFAAVLSD